MDLGDLLEASGAIMRGHFVLTSGRHSDVYFEKFRLLEQPHVLSVLCAQICAYFQRNDKIDLVAGPTTGGIIVAFEVARQMGVPAIYIETENGRKTLRRNAKVKPGARVLIVDDVLTTGTSLLESKDAIERAGGTVVAYAVLINRSEGDPDFGAPLYGAYKVEARSYPADSLPESLKAIPAVKPGTRKT